MSLEQPIAGTPLTLFALVMFIFWWRAGGRWLDRAVEPIALSGS